MKQTLAVLALAGALCLGLTSCGARGNGAAQDAQTNNNSSVNGSGQVGDLNQDEIGNGDGMVDDNMETQARRSALRRRTAYDYLNDGKYQADDEGKVKDRGSELGRDLTQGARDLIRDAKDLGRDMARDVGDAARSAGQAARDTGAAARDTIRDKLT